MAQIDETSIYTMFGQNPFLYRINDKLYEQGFETYGDLRDVSEDEFWALLGRISERNKSKIREIFSIFPPSFKSFQIG